MWISLRDDLPCMHVGHKRLSNGKKELIYSCPFGLYTESGSRVFGKKESVTIVEEPVSVVEEKPARRRRCGMNCKHERMKKYFNREASKKRE